MQTFRAAEAADIPAGATVVSIDGRIIGYFETRNAYRKGLDTLVGRLKGLGRLFVLSGDTDREKAALTETFGSSEDLHFNKSPEEKLEFVEDLQRDDRTVMMVGDGLNDAGALKTADFGVSITDDINSFTPAGDAILKGEAVQHLDRYIRFAKTGRRIIYASFVLSFLYNIVGLSFAVRGELSPVIAAVLMPLSSITVVIFTTLAVQWAARRLD